MKSAQTSYASGVLAPALRYNTDLALWRSGLAQADNLFVMKHGGVSNRPGTRFVAETTNNEPGRIIKFARTVGDVFGLVFGDGTLKQLKDGEISEFPDPPDGFDTKALDLSGTDWLLDDRAAYQQDYVTVTLDFEVLAAPTSPYIKLSSYGINLRSDMKLSMSYYRVADGAVLDDVGSANSPTLVVGQRYRAQISPLMYNGNYVKPYLVLDGVSIYSDPNSAALPMTDSRVAVADRRDHRLQTEGDATAEVRVYDYQVNHVFVGGSYPNYVITTTPQVLWKPTVADPTDTPPGDGYMRDQVNEVDVLNQNTPGSYVSPFGEAVDYLPVTSPYAVQDLPQVRYAQRENQIFFTHPEYPEYVLQRFAEGFWQMTPVSYTPELDTPENLVAAVGTTAPGTGGVTVEYKVSAVTFDGLESEPTELVSIPSLPDPEAWAPGSWVDVSWDEVPDADRYVIYKNINGYFGYIGTADSLSFRDNNILPDGSDTPTTYQEPISKVDDFPTAVNIYQQRKVYGGSNNNPNRAWLTRTGTMADLSLNYPLKDTSAITVDLEAEEVNGVQHFLSTKNLIAFTNNGTWNVNSGSLREGLSYTNIRFDLEDDTGCSYLRPLKSGRSVLMVPTFRKGVRELAANFQAQGTQGRNLEIMSDHLFDGDPIVDWDFQRDQDRLYCIMASGVCNVLTYIPEQQLIAWTQWQTDGAYESVCVIPGDDRYVPYFIVNRNGVRCIEELAERSADGLFLDSAKEFSIPTPVSAVAGFEHLEGQDITGVIDGVVTTGLTADEFGSVFLPVPGKEIVLGLGYTADFETLDLAYGTQEGTGFADLKAIPEITLTLEDTLGIEVGPDADNLSDFNAVPDSSGFLNGKFTDVIAPDWNNRGRVHVRQSQPLPVTISSHISDGRGSDI